MPRLDGRPRTRPRLRRRPLERGGFPGLRRGQGPAARSIMHQLHSDIVHRLDEAPGRKLEGDALMTNVPGLAPRRPHGRLPARPPRRSRRTGPWPPSIAAGAARRSASWRRRSRPWARPTARSPRDMLAALGPLHRRGLLRGRARGPGGVPAGRIPARPSSSNGDTPGIQSPPERKYLLDLRAANLWLLAGLGFKKTNIFNPGPACTHCEPRLLSYRRHPADPRRMYNFIGWSF